MGAVPAGEAYGSCQIGAIPRDRSTSLNFQRRTLRTGSTGNSGWSGNGIMACNPPQSIGDGPCPKCPVQLQHSPCLDISNMRNRLSDGSMECGVSVFPLVRLTYWAEGRFIIRAEESVEWKASLTGKWPCALQRKNVSGRHRVLRGFP